MRNTTFKSTIVGLVLVYLPGCSIPTPYVKPTKTWRGTVLWSKSTPEPGVHYCQRLAVGADSVAQKELAGGIILGILASGAAIAGAAMGPGASEGWVDKNRNALVMGLGGILAVPTTILLMRSKDASMASAAAGSGIELDDRAAMTKCLKAREAWAGSRAEAAEYAKSSFNERLKTLQDSKDKADTEAEKKRADAADAAGKGDQAAKERLEKEALAAEERSRALGARITDEVIGKK